MYAFSGDPITFGHIDIIKRTAAVFDEVIVGIGINPSKKYTFTLAERTEMAERSLKHIPNVRVAAFEGLLVNYAYENGVSVIVKGVRNPEDFNYENVLHQVGESQRLGIDTHILFARPALAHVSSSAAKELVKNYGVSYEFVPLFVKQKLEERISEQYLIGVTGVIGSGKTYLCNEICKRTNDIDIHHIEFDDLAYQILNVLKEDAYQNVRLKIGQTFGKNLLRKDGFVNRKKLGEIIYNDVEALQELNAILETPITIRLQRELSNKKGLILINSSLLAEADMLHICCNNIVLIDVDKDTQHERLHKRRLSEGQIERREASQYSYSQKQEKIEEMIRKDGYGKIWNFNSSYNRKEDIDILCETIFRYLDIR